MNTKIFSILLISVFVFSLTQGIINFAQAQSSTNCPANTEVTGNQVNMVGEVTDDGGDPNLTVWFQFGKTNSFGSETARFSKFGIGLFCTTVTNLEACTAFSYRSAAQNSAGTSFGETKTFTTACNAPTVDIKANGSDGPITIPLNSSATLSWNSSNANSCFAFNGWSGNKALSGSEGTGNLSSSRTFTISCSGSGGSNSDSVAVNIETQNNFSVRKLVRNLSDGTSFSDSVLADPGEALSFMVEITASGSSLSNITLSDNLPNKISDIRNLKIDGQSIGGDIISGLRIDFLSANQTKTIIFDATIAQADQFAFGDTQLINTALAFTTSFSNSDTAKIIVNRKAVAGAATEVSTGLTNNLLLDSFFLPLTIALTVIWFFKVKIIRFEEWVDRRKRQYEEYKSKKTLQIKIAKIKFRGFLGKKVF